MATGAWTSQHSASLPRSWFLQGQAGFLACVFPGSFAFRFSWIYLLAALWPRYPRPRYWITLWIVVCSNSLIKSTCSYIRLHLWCFLDQKSEDAQLLVAFSSSDLTVDFTMFLNYGNWCSYGNLVHRFSDPNSGVWFWFIDPIPRKLSKLQCTISPSHSSFMISCISALFCSALTSSPQQAFYLSNHPHVMPFHVFPLHSMEDQLQPITGASKTKAGQGRERDAMVI